MKITITLNFVPLKHLSLIHNHGRIDSKDRTNALCQFVCLCEGLKLNELWMLKKEIVTAKQKPQLQQQNNQNCSWVETK